MRSTWCRHAGCMSFQMWPPPLKNTDRIPGIDALLQDADDMHSTINALHASFKQPAIGRRFLGVIFCFLAYLHRKCTSIVEFGCHFVCLTAFFSANFWHSSSLNLCNTHCNSVDMPRVWNSFPAELRTCNNSLHAFEDTGSLMTLLSRGSHSAPDYSVSVEFGAI